VLTHTRDGGGGGERERERERKKYLVRKREGERNTEREGGGGRDKACAYGWQCECATDIVVVKRAEGSAITGVKTRDELDVPHCTCTVARFEILQLCTYSVVRPTHHVSLHAPAGNLRCRPRRLASKFEDRGQKQQVCSTGKHQAPSGAAQSGASAFSVFVPTSVGSTKRCCPMRCGRVDSWSRCYFCNDTIFLADYAADSRL
jgi:hypothetical protein